MKNLLFLSVLMTLFFTVTLSAQKLGKFEKAIVVQFDEPYDALSIMPYGKSDTVVIVVNDQTKLHDKKGKEIKPETIVISMEVTVTFQTQLGEGDAEDQRIAQEIKLVLDLNSKEELNGLYESRIDGQTAIIDGRIVKLDEGGAIKGEKKKACKCQDSYTSFKDKSLKYGAVLKAEGEVKEDGFYHTKLIEVCENTYTPAKKELRKAIDGRMDTSKMTSTLTAGIITVGTISNTLYNGIEWNERVNRVGKKIMPHYLMKSETQSMDFRFYVVDSPVPNAFAYPNGLVFITKGLLDMIDNEAQLAFVLGHEIAHVSYDHGIKKLQEAKANERNLLIAEKAIIILKEGKRPAFVDKILGSFFNADVSSISLKALVSAFKTFLYIRPAFLSNLHGNKNEEQADRVALMYMHQAGYNITEVPKLWRKMMDENEAPSFAAKMKEDVQNTFLNKVTFDKENPWKSFEAPLQELIINKLLETVYSSHPETKKRFDCANRLISTHYKNVDFKEKVINTEKFEKVKQEETASDATVIKKD